MEILRLITHFFRITTVTDSGEIILHVILRNAFKTSWKTNFIQFSLLVGNTHTKYKYQIPEATNVKIWGDFLFPNFPQENIYRVASCSLITGICTVT